MRAQAPAIVAIMLGGLAALSGCAVGPDFATPQAPEIGQYLNRGETLRLSSADGQTQRLTPGDAQLVDWWHMFRSAALDQAISEGVAANAGLQAAQANLRQAEDLARAGAGIFYPQVAVQAQASRQTTSPAHIGANVPSTPFTVYSLGATVSYALDVFGGNRRAVEALSAQADVQRQAVGATWLTLTGTLVNTVIARAGYAEQYASTVELIRMVRDQLAITRAQVAAGTATHASELSLLSQLGSLEATLAPLAQRMDQADHLVATLIGRFPADVTPLTISLDSLTLPLDLPQVLPSELVRRRPDVLAAEAHLHVASAALGVATAAMLPAISLSASYGRANGSVADLFQPGAAVWGLAANVLAPIFEGGTLYYQREAAVAQLDGARAGYRSVVLSAFAQVADAMRALEHDAEAVDAQDRARRAAKDLMEELLANYRAGTAGYLQVLVANAQYQQATIGYLQARTQRLQDTVALFLALGGGWDVASSQPGR